MLVPNIIQHPLVRDGKSQAERQDLSSLAPESLALDGRNEQQLLAYLYEYAKSVAYYDEDMNAGNWQDFFRAGVSVQTAIISQYRPEQWKAQFDIFQRNFGDGLNRSNLSPVLDFLFDTIIQFQSWYDGLANDTALVNDQLVFNENELRRTIGNLIASNLRQSLSQLIAVANVWADKPTPSGQRNYDLPNLSSLDQELWGFNPATKSARDVALKGLLGRPSDFENAASAKLNEVFQVFFNAVRDITNTAKTIDATPSTQTHDPHLGLLYAFLQLFEKVRSTLNGMTKTHLDFYYRDVLGLVHKPHIPDEAHVVFELNKPYSEQRLIADTRLKNGKDNKGADVFFNLSDEIIVDKAQIQSLRTIHNDIKLYAAPAANSADGLGADFQDPNNVTWATLGQADDNLPARVGLMVASPLLRLSEGVRTITLKLICPIMLGLKELQNLYSFKIVEETLKFFKENNIDPTKFKSKVYVGTQSDVQQILETESGVSPFSLDSFEKTGVFDIELTGKKGWFRPAGKITLDIDIPSIADTVSFTLGAKEDPVIDADPALLLADYGIAEPLLRLTLNPYILNKNNGLYNAFKDRAIKGVIIKADVSGLQNVTIRTDEGVVDASQPFMPFGAVPGVDSVFSLEHPSFYGQKFTKCELVFGWDKLPKDGFAKHYEFYNIAGFNDDYFETTVKFGNLSQRTDQKLFTDFADKKSTFKHPDAAHPNPSSFSLNAPVVFTLETDFFHSIYPQVLATQMLAKTDDSGKPVTLSELIGLSNTVTNLTQPGCDPKITDIKNKINTEIDSKKGTLVTDVELEALKTFVTATTSTEVVCDPTLTDIKKTINDKIDLLKAKSLGVPPPPYTPIIKSVTLNYTVEATNEGITLFHLHPFEESNYEKVTLNGPLLPQFNDEGSLLIGLSDVTPGGTLDLLLQFVESTADSYLPAADIKWHYLKSNAWEVLEKGKNILDDGTQGLIRSGVVKMMIPFDIDRLSTILPAQYYWIKISAEHRTPAVCRSVALHTQATKVVFHAESENDLTRLRAPLKAASISNLAEADPLIKGVSQPYESFGGRAPEDDPAFYARASEYLRHKGRAVTLFDYEQLVLEAFPEIYKVKCITHTLAHRMSGKNVVDYEAAPGNVTVVVVPNVALLAIAERFEPKASRSQLEAIGTFLRSRISPFVRLRVMNPVFEAINTQFKVKFQAGRSPEFYRELLQKDIAQFLAPWAFESDAAIAFGGTVYRSSLVGFIENRKYVDYLEDFIMYKGEDEPTDEISTSSARAILISGKHDIDIL